MIELLLWLCIRFDQFIHRHFDHVMADDYTSFLYPPWELIVLDMRRNKRIPFLE